LAGRPIHAIFRHESRIFRKPEAAAAWCENAVVRSNQKEETPMRKFVLIALMAVAVLSITSRPSHAAYNYPWCAQYYDRSGIFSCAFASFEQCLTTMSGIGGNCMQNPNYTPAPLPRAEYRRPTKPRRHAHAY
jgi:hypothetical protein